MLVAKRLGLIFSSNLQDPTGGDFQLYTIGLDGSALEQITHEGTFNAFPMFRPGSNDLIFASNRDAGQNYYDIYFYTAQYIDPQKKRQIRPVH